MTPITKMLVQNTMEAPERVRWEEFRGNSIKRPKRKFDNLFRETKGRRESNISLASSSMRGIDQIVSWCSFFFLSSSFFSLYLRFRAESWKSGVDVERDQFESTSQASRYECRRLRSSDSNRRESLSRFLHVSLTLSLWGRYFSYFRY